MLKFLFILGFIVFTSILLCGLILHHATRYWILVQIFVCYISMHILILTCNNFFYEEIQNCPNIFFVHFSEKYLSRFADEYTNDYKNVSKLFNNTFLGNY